MQDMTDDAFDRALITAAFALAGRDGWSAMTIPAAAQEAGLSLPLTRARFACKAALLAGFGRLADQAAVAEPTSPHQPPQERLFDMLMHRIDVLQAHRAGVLALFRALPAQPHTALALAAASRASMQFLLQAAGLATPPLAFLRSHGLLGVWLWTVRAWQRDESPDLSATMAALDSALSRAAQIARSWSSETVAPAPPEPPLAGSTL